uniref:BHLH domain-containing protein n=1 Tax=Meloidogyne hapla TaxID=6305 RepID=A0A1I8BTZ6_MELHA
MPKICGKFLFSSMLDTEEFKYLEATCSKNERKGLSNNRISTRGASKQRRDQINNELTEIRNILPLTSLMKQNLFQLQILSLSCTFIRCHQYLRLLNKNINKNSSISSINCSVINAALNDNFLIAINEEGKLLVLSDNFSQDREPISTIEWMAQSDSLFDLIDVRDHQSLNEIIFNEDKLERASQSNEKSIAFVCRWRTPKLGGVTKRHPDWNGKPTLVNGHFISSQKGNKRIFVGFCRPLLFSTSCPSNYNDPSIMRFWMDKKLRIEALCQK